MLSPGTHLVNLAKQPTIEHVTRDSFFDFEGIRFSPRALVFQDVFEGETKELEFTLQNIKDVPVVVRIYPPNSYAFRLNYVDRKRLLAPGLTITGNLSFTNRRHSVARLMIEIFINSMFVEYPVHVYMAAPLLTIEPPAISFGVVDVGSSAVVRYLVLRNLGAVGSKFYVDLGSNELDLVATPYRGILRAHSEVIIRLEMVGVYEGVYFKEFWISGAVRPLRCPVSVTVIVPKLVVYHPNTTGDFTLIDFDPTYVGEQRHEAMIVRNVSSQTTTFVVLAEVNNELLTLEKVRHTVPAYDMFSIEPSEGRMQPFEGRIFTLSFKPTSNGWGHTTKATVAKDFLVFVRILRVQCMDLAEIGEYIENIERGTAEDVVDISESGMLANYETFVEEVPDKSVPAASESTIGSTAQSSPSAVPTGPIVRLCLHGEAIAPILEVEPTAIDFGRVEIGYEETRVLMLSNPSLLLPLGFRYKKETNFHTVPVEGLLEPLQSVEIAITARPTTIGFKQRRLSFHLFEKWKKTIVGHVSFRVKFDAPAITTKRKPQFNLGLKPILTKEVGVGIEDVKFKTVIEKPQAAMVQASKSRRCPWAKPAALVHKTIEKDPVFTKSAVSTRKTSEKTKSPKELVTSVSMLDMSRRKEKAIITGYTGTSVLLNTRNFNFTGDTTLGLACQTQDNVSMPSEVSGSWVKISQHTNGKYKFVLHTEREKPEPEGTPWRTTKKNVRYCKKGISPKSDAIIAFPNDCQRSLRQWPKDDLCRAIFTGTERYSCPDDIDNTLTPEEKAFKNWHNDTYEGFIRYTGGLLYKRNEMERIFTKANMDFTYPGKEYEVSCNKLYQLLGVKPPVEVRADTATKLTALRRVKAQGPLKAAEHFVPLTPQLIYNVKVSPKAVDFGKVAPDSDSVETLYLQNLNNFAVKIHILPGRSGVRIPQGDTVILKANSQMSLNMVFNADFLGRYNGFMNYVINDNHKFEVTVSADVVRKSLKLTTTEVVFGLKSSEEAFQSHFMAVGITNNLQAYTKYHWELPNNTSFTPQPISGTIPPRRTLMSAIVSTPNPHGSQWSDLVLRTSESNVYQVLKCSYIPRKIKVVFVQPKLTITDIPLNVRTTVSTLVHNANYEDMMFKVLNPEPIHGFEVFPKSGIIKARSYHTIELHMKLCAVMEFDLIVTLIIQRTFHLDLNVHGNVIYPNVSIKPTTLRLRRISADSFDSLMLYVENKSQANVQVQFRLEDYPEYYMSSSPRKRNQSYGPEGFTLLPGRSQQFYLNFSPEDIATYEFYLPVVINGILGPPSVEDNDSQKPLTYLGPLEKFYKQTATFLRDQIPKRLPSVRVDCTVAGHILSFSKLNFHFEMFVDGKVQIQHEDLRISNDHRKAVTFCIRIDDLSTKVAPFTIIHVDGEYPEILPKIIIAKLEPGEFMVLRISFRPTTHGNFYTESPIFVRGYGLGTVFNYLYLTGTYPAPCLRSKSSEVFFLPVPLDVESEALVILYASYHTTNTEMNAVVAPVQDSSGCELSTTITVTFMDGNTVHANLEHMYVRVQLLFRSSQRASFQTTVTFSDTLGSATTITVTATADNCLLTMHGYLRLQGITNEQERNKELSVAEEVSPQEQRAIPSVRANLVKTQSLEKEKSSSSASNSDKMSGPGSSQLPLHWFPPRPPDPIIQSVSQYCSADVAPHALDVGSYVSTGTESPDQQLAGKKASTVSEASELSNKLATSYPLFPGDEDTSDYAQHMQATLSAAETWVYEQGFKCAFATSIPDGLTLMMSGLIPNTASGSDSRDSFIMKTIIDLLFNLIGPTVLKIFPKLLAPTDNTQRVVQAYTTYSQLMDFLVIHTACLIHVRPEFLLNYDDYVVYIKKVRPVIPPGPHTSWPSLQVTGKSDSTNIPPETRPASPPIPHNIPTNSHYQLTHKFDPECKLCTYVIPKEKFDLRSKQSWLDVILQIYKAFVLPKITLESYNDISRWHLKTSVTKPSTASQCMVNPSVKHRSSSDPMGGKVKHVTESSATGLITTKHTNFNSKLHYWPEPTTNNERGLPESILLAWMSAHFELQRSQLWNSSAEADGGGVPAPREVTNFDVDFCDGLVLVAVTASYCPYLVPLYFADLFPNPSTAEQGYHNAVRLTQAWCNVSLGFTVSPSDIVNPNAVFMLMLTTSLYDILPTLFPKETILFQTGLTMDVTRKVQLVNPSSHRVAYTIKIIGNESSFFSLERSSPIVYIQSREKTSITLRYQARKICLVKTTLVLCGSTLSPNFAKHMVFTLEGEPIHLQTSDSFSLSTPLCRPTDVTIPITPPYHVPAEYEIWCTEAEPTNARDFSAEPWRELRKRKVPRRLFLTKARLLCANPPQEKSPLSMTVACLAPTTRDFWLVFMHPDVGDFIVKITIAPRKAEAQAHITVGMPLGWHEGPCFCESTWETRDVGTEGCPLRTVIPVPRRNAELWNAVRVMFEKALDEQERDFWSNHLETNIGLRLIQWLLGDTKDSVSAEFEHIFQTSVTYSVVCSAPKMIRLPGRLTIPDVRLTTNIDMPVHVSSSTPNPYQVTLTLTSDSGQEVRNFHVNFTDHERSPSVTPTP